MFSPLIILGLVMVGSDCISIIRADSNSTQKELQSLDSKRCRCLTTLNEILNEIQQDMNYARRTISLEKLTGNMYKKLNEVEDTYKEHFVGFQDSKNLLAYSLDSLASSMKLNKTIDQTADNLAIIVDKLENETNFLSDKVVSSKEPGSKLKDEMAHVISKMEETFERHTNQQLEFVEIVRRLHAKNSDNLESNQPSPFVGKLYSKQLSAMIVDQIVDGALLKSIYRNASRQTDKIDELLYECRSYRLSRASSLVESRLMASNATGATFRDKLSSVALIISDMSELRNKTLSRWTTIKKSLPLLMTVGGQAGIQTELPDVFSGSRIKMNKLAQRLQDMRHYHDQLKLDVVRLEEMSKFTRDLTRKTKVKNTRSRNLRLNYN